MVQWTGTDSTSTQGHRGTKATFSKRAGKRGVRWQAKVRHLGHPPQTRTFDTLSAARPWATEIEAAINRGHTFPHPSTRKLLVRDAVKKYRKYLEVTASAKLYKRNHHLGWIETELRAFRLVELTPARIIAARDLDRRAKDDVMRV